VARQDQAAKLREVWEQRAVRPKPPWRLEPLTLITREENKPTPNHNSPRNGESSSSPSGCTTPTRQRGDTVGGIRTDGRAGVSQASLWQVQLL